MSQNSPGFHLAVKKAFASDQLIFEPIRIIDFDASRWKLLLVLDPRAWQELLTSWHDVHAGPTSMLTFLRDVSCATVSDSSVDTLC